MSSNRIKQGGWAGVLAAALFVLTTFLALVAPVDLVYDSPADYLHQIVLLAAFVATIFAVAGLDARQRPFQRYGRLGTAGAVFTLIGYGVVTVVVLTGIVMAGRVLTEIRIVGAVGVVIGSILLGAATLRTGDLPWWCGVLLIVAFPLGDLVNSLLPGSEGLILALLWASVGIALLSRTSSLPTQVGGQQLAAT